MVISTSPSMTLEDYLAYEPETDGRYELRQGRLVEMGAESDVNVSIAMFLISVLLKFVPYSRLRRGTEIAVPGEKAETRYPDLLVLNQDGVAALSGNRRSLITFDMPEPALVIEVVSNSERDKRSRERDYEDKRWEYAQRGVPEYWIIDPIAKVVIVLVLDETLNNKRYREIRFKDDQRLDSPMFSELNLIASDVLKAGGIE
ncbi:MAG: Uma2 family endonuclease [Cyanobacteria bacterium P01_F01_bin.150]